MTPEPVPRSRESRETPILDCLYLGQLGQLMLSNESWHLFKHLFRDKRELQDLLGAVSPVRNDCAHFRNVPDKELSRCAVACDDILAIVARAPIESTVGVVATS